MAQQHHPEHDFLVLQQSDEPTAGISELREAHAAGLERSKDPEWLASESHGCIGCDSCGTQPITGTRFKCLSSACNADLCTSCMAQGHHPEHDMLAIRKPHRRTSLIFLWQLKYLNGLE
ncbi:uncharacterized protein LOC129584456 [Paramacrobiotus metropolitanus]|uniref:uncharacterized protein LOC129584456 n=1 Tax=Paramacrobiotus metropolitanus TaxID=2943436 RepID=UPI002445D18F|nr:uncharacterized protein LOC129584456 [Paramacrobiotus metropolitanus]